MREITFKTAADADRSAGAAVGKNWVHFGYQTLSAKPPSLLLYRKGSEEVAAQIPFPAPEAEDGFCSMKVWMDAEEFEYNFLDNGQVVTDPFAKRIAGRKAFGAEPPASPHGLRGAFLTRQYRWGADRLPDIPYDEAVIYQLHVRGFTMHPQSGVRHPGTFAGLKEKIPYLKSLGVNAVKLMPAYEFAECSRPAVYTGAPRTQQEAMAQAFLPAIAEAPYRTAGKGFKAPGNDNEDQNGERTACGKAISRTADRDIKAPGNNSEDQNGERTACGEATPRTADRGFKTPGNNSEDQGGKRTARGKTTSRTAGNGPKAGTNREADQSRERAVLETARRMPVHMNFWGYGPGFYFAPKASYAAGDCEDVELKDLIRALHASKMEIILEFSFTDETDMGLICACLSYWAKEYRVDGFSVLCRERLFGELARLPLFHSRKLFCGWYPEDVLRSNQKETGQRLAQQNDGFMNDCRCLLKGDSFFLDAFARRTRQNPSGCAQINYMTNHDGFTLLDLVSYDHKHNEANQENGQDGTDYNCSWNCGEEGPSVKRSILKLRMRQRKNAYAMMLFSQGTPMLLSGDEFGNSQAGNNNPYCQDNEISWVDWSKKRSGRELTDFVRSAIAFRKKHPVLRQKTEPRCQDFLASGFPDLSFHGERAWYAGQDGTSLHIGCLYSGKYAGESGFLYLAWNFHWDTKTFALPVLPKGFSWFCVMDTSLQDSFPENEEPKASAGCRSFTVPARTVVILEGRNSEGQ